MSNILTLFISQTYNDGAVYAFANIGKEIETNFVLKASSETFENKNIAIFPRATTSHSSRYGYATANLGRINGDRYDDFAIGAPFEGNGVVYIYFGSETFWSDEAGGHNEGVQL